MKKNLHECLCNRHREKGRIRMMRRLLFLSIALILFGVNTAFAQEVKFNFQMKNATLENLFKKVEKNSEYRFIYQVDDLKNLTKFDVDVKDLSISQVLDKYLKNFDLGYKFDSKYIIIYKKDEKAVKEEKISIKGRITDKDGYALLGASILEIGTANGVTTNKDGQFTLDVKNTMATIRVSFVGFETQYISVGNKTDFKVVLESSTSDLSEVVITGYQVIAKEKVTGAVVTIQEEDLGKKNSLNIIDNIEGKIPGLVTYRGVTSIRGISTMRAEMNPLIVLDGLPIEGSIEDINPYDVESITVLKDAAAAAIYGVRASNGVIVITTKRAKGKGKTTIEFSTDVTIQDKPDYSYHNLMNATEQVNWEKDYYSWYFSTENTTVGDPITTFEDNYLSEITSVSPIQYAYYQLAKNDGSITQTEVDALLEQYKQNDFLEEYKKHVLLNQVITQYNLAVRTNNEKSQTNLVINYKTDNSGIINAYDRRLNLFLKGKYNVAKWLDVDYGVNIITGKAKSHNNTYATNPFNQPAYMSMFDDNGNRLYTITHFRSQNSMTEDIPELRSFKYNRLDELERDFRTTNTLNMRYFLNLNFKVMPGLTFNPMFQYEDNRTDVSTYSEADSYTMRWLYNIYTTRSGSEGAYTYNHLLPEGGRLITSQTKSPNYTARAQVNYNKDFGKHTVAVIAGTEFRQTRYYGTSSALFGYDEQLQTQLTSSLDLFTMYNLQSVFWRLGQDQQASDYNEIGGVYHLIPDIKHRYASAYANATYTFDQKYNLFGSIRKDYADLFGGDKKYRGRPLWSVGASWILSSEDFMKNIDFVDYLKFRISYGLTGNIDPRTTAVLTAETGTNASTVLANATITNPPNPQLRWEKTATTNLGFDFILFDSRLRGSLDWYHRKGTDLFSRKRLDPSEGFTDLVINNASMINKGIEISLNYDWIRPADRDGFAWSSSLILSHNKNEITYVDEVTTSPLSLAAGSGFKEGYPVNALYSFQYAELNDIGQPTWYKTDGSTASTLFSSSDLDALVYSGTTDPKVNISFTNEFSYKGFSLSVFAVFYGGHVLRGPALSARQYPSYAALPAYLTDRWTPENTDTDVPGSGRYYSYTSGISQMYYSDFRVRPADFIKIRNIVFGYELPANIAAKIKASKIKLRFQVNNPKALWVKQKDFHIDPETGGLPAPTSYVLGLNINFENN